MTCYLDLIALMSCQIIINYEFFLMRSLKLNVVESYVVRIQSFRISFIKLLKYDSFIMMIVKVGYKHMGYIL